MLWKQPSLKPYQGQGAGDALLPAGAPPNLERFLNGLLILVALHFLIQAAIYFSCLFLLLPMSFVVSNVVCGAKSIMAAASNQHMKIHLGKGAGESTQEKMLPACLLGLEELIVSLALAYFLVRAGLIFCNLIFLLPLIFLLKEIT